MNISEFLGTASATTIGDRLASLRMTSLSNMKMNLPGPFHFFFFDPKDDFAARLRDGRC
jgi:hypothetical protein